MRRPFVLLMLMILSLPAVAAVRIVSATDTVDFGRIKETEGKKTLRAYVVNSGDEPMALLKVQPTCGCTAVNFMKEPVAPGDSAWIDLTYNPYRRPGRFEKGVKVYPVDGEMIRIPITGVVDASEETIANMFPASGGLLNISSTLLTPAGTLGKNGRTLYVDFYNSSGATVWPLLESPYEAVETESFPPAIAPGEKGMIGIYIDSKKEQRKGNIEYILPLYTSHNSSNLKQNGNPVEIKILISTDNE